ncbi:MAG TPA: hypothetical protein VF902_03035 [Coriobacteriia bacterium]
MPQSKLVESIQKFLDDLAVDAVEERIVDYVVREVRNGRKLADALADPYVKNRLSEEKLAHVLENPEVIGAIEREIANAFGTRDFGFSD